MKLSALLAACVLFGTPSATRPQTSESLPRIVEQMSGGTPLQATYFAAPKAKGGATRGVEFKTSDGVVLKGSYFAADKPGPGVLLLHQINRTRESWKDVAPQLAAAGIHALTVDTRGHGESGGTRWERLSEPEQGKHWRGWPEDVDAALEFLRSQPGVDKNRIGLCGAGLLGVDNSVDATRRHPDGIKSLALLSGETFYDGLTFLHQASQLPALFVTSDLDEYPPTSEAMQLLYITASNPEKKLVHYSAAQDAPWLWYEPFDIGKVPGTGNHGTDLFQGHPDLPGMIVQWLVTTLMKTPGNAPADTVGAAEILNLMREPGGVPKAERQLLEARRSNPQAQPWPEVATDIIGADYLRVGNIKAAIEIFKLNLLAYPESANANDDLAAAYLEDGQKELARPLAEKALKLVNAHDKWASDWSDTQQRREQVRKSIESTLRKLGEAN